MSIRQLASAILVGAALAIPIVVRAQTTSDAPQCFLDDAQVVSVKPYYGKLPLGSSDLPPLLGAKVELAPTDRLTAVELEERVQQLLEARTKTPLPDCLTDVGRVYIESGDLGEAAAVTFTARDPSQAEQVFRRLQLLVKH